MTEPPLPIYPGSVQGATIEAALAGHAATVLRVGPKRLDKADRRLVSAIRDAHLAHAATLRTPDPTDPTSGPGPSPPTTSPSGSATPPSFATAVKLLVEAERRAAAAHRRGALAADGLGALLWGSLATSAGVFAAVLAATDLAGEDPEPTGSVTVRARAPMPVVGVAEAEQQLVRQLHAAVYGYQLALGRLGGARRDAAAKRLKQHRILRDRLTARLVERKAEVPVAEAAYVPSTVPRNAPTAAKLLRQLETALTPFGGLWLAAAGSPEERGGALDTLRRTTDAARSWGAAVPAWPGWSPA